jgi:hypothetical protein
VKNNVLITVRERGKIVTRRDGHNVWVEAGNQFLSQLISYSSYSPLTPERSDRIRYAGLGIGGVGQSDPGADAAPFTTYYPAGSDPHATDGHSYNKDYPINPAITTLERPVRCFLGSWDPYTAPNPLDEWLIYRSFPTHQTLTSFSLHSIVSGPVGDVIDGTTLTYMPLSEIGLFTSAAALDEPFNPLVAYFSFDTIQMTPDTVIDIVWTVRF